MDNQITLTELDYARLSQLTLSEGSFKLLNSGTYPSYGPRLTGLRKLNPMR